MATAVMTIEEATDLFNSIPDADDFKKFGKDLADDITNRTKMVESLVMNFSEKLDTGVENQSKRIANFIQESSKSSAASLMGLTETISKSYEREIRQNRNIENTLGAFANYAATANQKIEDVADDNSKSLSQMIQEQIDERKQLLIEGREGKKLSQAEFKAVSDSLLSLENTLKNSKESEIEKLKKDLNNQKKERADLVKVFEENRKQLEIGLSMADNEEDYLAILKALKDNEDKSTKAYAKLLEDQKKQRTQIEEQIEIQKQQLEFDRKSFLADEKTRREAERDARKVGAKDEIKEASSEFLGIDLSELVDHPLVNLLTGIFTKVKKVMGFISKIFNSTFLIGGAIIAGLTVATLKSKNFWKLVGNIFKGIFKLVKGAFKLISDNWDIIWPAIVGGFKVIKTTWDFFADGVNAFWGIINGIFFETDAFMTGIQETVSGIGVWINEITGNIPVIGGFVTYLFDNLAAQIQNTIHIIKTVPGLIWDLITNSAKMWFDAFILLLDGDIMGAFGRLKDGFINQIQIIVDYIYDLPIIKFFEETFQNMIKNIMKIPFVKELFGIDDEDLIFQPTTIQGAVDENRRLREESSKLESGSEEQKKILEQIRVNQVFIEEQTKIQKAKESERENENKRRQVEAEETAARTPQPKDTSKDVIAAINKMGKDVSKSIKDQPTPELVTQTMVGSPAVPVPGQTTVRMA